MSIRMNLHFNLDRRHMVRNQIRSKRLPWPGMVLGAMGVVYSIHIAHTRSCLYEHAFPADYLPYMGTKTKQPSYSFVFYTNIEGNT